MEVFSGPGYIVAPTFGVRVAGLPVAVLDELRLDGIWPDLDELLALSCWLTEEGHALADALYGLVSEYSGSELKPLLVALRRALFTRRRPSPRAWSPAVRQLLPAELAGRIGNWDRCLTAWRRRAEQLPHTLAAELEVKRKALRAAAGSDAFQQGLLQASPVLFGELQKWLSDPDRQPGQQTLLGLSKYLARVVAKTSPYATFTISGLGRWCAQGPAARPQDTFSWRSAIELDRWVAQQLVARLAHDPLLFGDLRLRLNPSMFTDAGRIWFLGASAGEPLTSVPMTPVLRECVRFVRGTPGCRVGAVREHLLRLGGGRLEAAGAEHFVRQLIEAGLLEPRSPLTDQADDPLDAVIAWLAPSADAGLARLRDLLVDVQANLRAYAAETAPHQRRDRREAVYRLIGEAFGCLADGGSDDNTALPAKNLFFENAVVTSPVAELGWDRWAPVFEDLDAVRRFCALFSSSMPLKLALAAQFAGLYGMRAQVPFLSFYRDVQQLIAAGTAPMVGCPGGAELGWLQRRSVVTPDADLAGSSVKQVRELGRLRHEAVSVLRAVPAGVNGAVSIDRRLLGDIAAGWPPHVRPPESICCYAQAITGAGTPHLVLNLISTGYGRGRNRLERLVRQAGHGQLHAGPPALRVTHSTVLLAETRSALGTNLNLREPSVPHEIQYPFTSSDRPESSQIRLGDLRVTSDPGDGLLRLTLAPGGDQVRPLHLGLVAHSSLPPAVQFLVRMFGEPPVSGPAGWLIFPAMAPPAARLQSAPRLSVGHVTLSRASWRARGQDLPRRAKGEGDSSFLPRMLMWLREHGIPQRCFVRVLPMRGDEPDLSPMSKERKPVFVDFANWFLFASFERSARRPDDLVIFEEVLPEFADAPFYAGQQRVTEYLFELSASEVSYACREPTPSAGGSGA